MTKRCADWADVNKLCVYNTTKKKKEIEKAAGATSFSRELLLFDVQMKPCAAPCYLASLKAMLLHSNCCAKKMIGSFYRDLEKKKACYSQRQRPPAQRCSNFKMKMGLFSL